MPHKWRGKRKPSNVEPEVAAAELERIWLEHDQQLRPQDVVEDARPKTALLHPAFDWVDKHAAEEWRIHQARLLIRSIVVEQPDGGKTHKYVHVDVRREEQPKAQFYQASSVLMENPEEFFAALREAKRALEAAVERYRALQNLAKTSGKEDDQTSKLALIMEALTTARTLTERLQ